MKDIGICEDCKKGNHDECINNDPNNDEWWCECPDEPRKDVKPSC